MQQLQRIQQCMDGIIRHLRRHCNEPRRWRRLPNALPECAEYDGFCCLTGEHGDLVLCQDPDRFLRCRARLVKPDACHVERRNGPLRADLCLWGEFGDRLRFYNYRGTFRGTSVTGTDGTEGLTIQAYGFGLGAIYPSGVTPGPTNYLFAGGATSGDPTIIDAPSGSGEVIDLQVSAATIAMLSVTGFTLNSGTLYGWNNDTSLSRGAADNVDCGNGTQGDASCAFAAGLHETTLATLASASNISPATGMFSLSGTSPISTITLPTGVSSTVGACLDILATGAWSTTTVGNIATAMTAISGTQYRACYFGSAWYIK